MPSHLAIGEGLHAPPFYYGAFRKPRFNNSGQLLESWPDKEGANEFAAYLREQGRPVDAYWGQVSGVVTKWDRFMNWMAIKYRDDYVVWATIKRLEI